MKLNIDCVRDILLICEEIPLNDYFSFNELSSRLKQYDKDELTYNCLKLKEANYLSVVTKTHDCKATVVRINDITFQGHEFLNNIRSSKILERSKNVASKIGATSLQAFTQISTGIVLALIKSELGLL